MTVALRNRYDVLVAVQKTIRSLVVGGADYTNDLRNQADAAPAQQRVQLGSFTEPPIILSSGVAFVSLYDGSNATAPGEGLRKWRNTGATLITGWAVGGLTPSARLAAAGALEVDLKRALLSNPQLRTAADPSVATVARFALSSQTFDGKDLVEAGQANDLKQMGVVEMTLTAVWDDFHTDKLATFTGIT